MEFISMIFTVIFGFIIGLMLFLLSRQSGTVLKAVYAIFSIVSNIFRSIPFIVLIVLFIPAMSAIFGSFIGAIPAVLPLTVSASPLYARMVEVAFREVDEGVLEAANAMGASGLQKVFQVLVPESLPALISGMSITAVSMIGYTAMACVVGGGGLGGLAIQEGFSRNNYTVTMVATVIILIIVFILQFIGDLLVKKVDKRK
jgi:D-methionine transport system permease protein